MPIKPFARSYPDDRATANFESAVATCWESIIKHPLLQNLQIVKNVAITTSDTIVNHGLNHPLNGWVLIRNSANIVVYESATVNPSPNATIILKASGSGTISLMFF